MVGGSREKGPEFFLGRFGKSGGKVDMELYVQMSSLACLLVDQAFSNNLMQDLRTE
jgi:hypothetical protein